MALGGEHKPPCCGKVQNLRIARNLAYDKRQRVASYAFFHRPKRIGRMTGFHMDKPVTLLGR